MRAWIITSVLLLLPAGAVAQQGPSSELAQAYQLCQAHAAPRNTFHPGFENCAEVVQQYHAAQAAKMDAQPKPPPPHDDTRDRDLINKALKK